MQGLLYLRTRKGKRGFIHFGKMAKKKKPVCLTTKDNYRSQDLAHQWTMQSYIKLERSPAFQGKVHEQTDLNHSTTFKKVLGRAQPKTFSCKPSDCLPAWFIHKGNRKVLQLCILFCAHGNKKEYQLNGEHFDVIHGWSAFRCQI